MKSDEGVLRMKLFGFLDDLLNNEAREVGSLSFTILNISSKQEYFYRLWTVRSPFLAKSGLVCSLV